MVLRPCGISWRLPGRSDESRSAGTPDQFEAVDEETFVIKLDRPSKLTLPDLAVPVPFIINSVEAKANATDADPWATEYLHMTPAGSGAYKMARWDTGPAARLRPQRRMGRGAAAGASSASSSAKCQAPATRRALIERGDVQVAFDIPDQGCQRAGGQDRRFSAPDRKLHALPVPKRHSSSRSRMRTSARPSPMRFPTRTSFRPPPMAVACRCGAAKKRSTISHGRANPLLRPTWTRPRNCWRASPRRRLRVPLSISSDLAYWMEPTALLIQEALGKIGIKADDRKDPGRQLAHGRAGRKAAAAASGEFRRLAEHTRLLFLLGLSGRAPVQLVQLPQRGDREAGRRDAAHGDGRPRIRAQDQAHDRDRVRRRCRASRSTSLR